MFVTEHEFQLPKGYVDAQGNLHRDGIMRLATAADEILPMKDPRVHGLPAYLIVILLSRVVVKLGSLPQVHCGVIEGLFAEDLAYLQTLYNRLNGLGGKPATVRCPKCRHDFEVESPLGGIVGYPLDRVYREVAYLSCRVHWTLEEVLNLEHAERRRWIEEVEMVEIDRGT